MPSAMFLVPMGILATVMVSLFHLAAAPATIFARGSLFSHPSSQNMRSAVLSDMIVESAIEKVKQRRDVVHRCHRSAAEYGPAPSVEDCNGAIKQLQAVKDDITVKLVEGCFGVSSGNCTASVCPQRLGTSTISPSLAAQYMTNSVMTECIANGQRGWYLDRDYGIGVYLT